MSDGSKNFTSKGGGYEREDQTWVDYRTVSPYALARSMYADKAGHHIVPNKAEYFYQTRVALTPSTPWYSLYIDAQVEPLFMEQPPVYDVPASYESFLKNVNRAGQGIDDYTMDVAQYALMDAVVFLASGYDADEEKYPWFYYHTAPQLNMELTELDQFGAVVKYCFTTKHEENNKTHYLHDVYQDNTYTQYKSTKQDELGDVSKETVNSMPIKAIYSQRKEQGKVLPEPKNNRIAELCVAVLNSSSDQRWVLRVQGHSILTISSDTVPDGVNGSVDGVLHIDTADSQGGAEFVSPPAELSKEQRESKQELLSQLFEVMRHGGVIAQKSSMIPESGASKVFTFAPVNKAVGKVRGIAEMVLEYMQDSVKYYTSTDISITADYKTDFTPSAPMDIADLIVVLNEFKSYDASELEMAALKQMALQLTGDSSLHDAIEAINYDTVVDLIE